MNKFAKVMCMIAVVALAFTSCKKNQNEKTFIKNGTTEQFVEVFDDEDGEKAYLVNNSMVFEDGDMFMLFNYKTDGKHLHARYKLNAASNIWYEQPKPGTTDVYVTGIDEKDADGAWYAFYPADNVYNIDYTYGHAEATFEVSPEQEYRKNSNGVMVPADAMYMACKDDSHTTALDDIQLNFRNICGILSLKLYSPQGKEVTKIEVVDKAFNVVGDITCNVDQIDADALQSLCNNYNFETDATPAFYTMLHDTYGYSIENGNKKITLTCPNPVALGKKKSEATQFLIVMRPLALLKGFDLVVYFKDAPKVTIESSKDNRIRPNYIKNMAAINVG